MLNFHPSIKRKMGIFKKNPYFLKNKDWYFIEKDVLGYDTYSITKLGKSIPEVYKSYLEFYNIKSEDIFLNGGTDVNSEFELKITNKIRNDLKAKGFSEREIEKYIYEFLHIEEIMSTKEKREAEQLFSELNKEFQEYYKNKLNKNLDNKQTQNNLTYKNEYKKSTTLEQNTGLKTDVEYSNKIIDKIKTKNAKFKKR